MRYDVVTIVASRRGASQLRELVSHLPPQFGVPIVCLTETDSRTVEDLAALTRLPVKWAEAGQTLQPGTIYVSPAGSSILLLPDRRVTLTPFGAESTAQRPVDSFLASAGRVYGDRALGITLAGFHDDGAEGAHSLKRRGGTMLVLDRATAEFYGMAEPIIHAGAYDRILTAGEVADALRATFTGRDLLESAELQFELGSLLESALTISGTNMGNVLLREPVVDQLHIVAYRGLSKAFLDRFSVVHPNDGTACAKALRSKHRVVIEDVFKDPDYADYHQVVRNAGYSAVQCTPFLEQDIVIGVFSTFYPYPHPLSMYEAKNLDAFAEQARELIAQRG